MLLLETTTCRLRRSILCYVYTMGSDAQRQARLPATKCKRVGIRIHNPEGIIIGAIEVLR